MSLGQALSYIDLYAWYQAATLIFTLLWLFSSYHADQVAYPCGFSWGSRCRWSTLDWATVNGKWKRKRKAEKGNGRHCNRYIVQAS